MSHPLLGSVVRGSEGWEWAADLEEVYDTEQHLLYVACTRGRDHLLVTVVEQRRSSCRISECDTGSTSVSPGPSWAHCPEMLVCRVTTHAEAEQSELIRTW
jgi:hypothetical protein